MQLLAVFMVLFICLPSVVMPPLSFWFYLFESSLFFLVDSRKRFVDFIYLWNENNNKNQSTFCSIDFFLLYSVFFLIYFSCNLDFFPSPDFRVFFSSFPSGVEFETFLLRGGVFITVTSLDAFFWSLSFGVLCSHLMCICVCCYCPCGFFFISFVNTVGFIDMCEPSDFPSVLDQ